SLGAVEETLLDRDPRHQHRGLISRAHALAQDRIDRKLGMSVDPECLFGAGDQEDQADLGIGDDVLHPEDQLVALAIGDEQRRRIFDCNETRSVALGRNVDIALGIGGGEEKQWRFSDELYRQRLELTPYLGRHQRMRRSDVLAQLLQAGYSIINWSV